MTHTNSLGTFNQPSEASIPLLLEKIALQGYHVERSFDLRAAREAHVGCTCPHHGTEKCDCQIVVLLIYGQEERPVTLVAHGRDGRTRFALVNHPDDDFSIPIVEEIKQIIRVEDPTEGRRNPRYDG